MRCAQSSGLRLLAAGRRPVALVEADTGTGGAGLHPLAGEPDAGRAPDPTVSS
jgi:hypothetical protein